jgi:tetratricopeptide (TPR) repeat protein
MRNRLIAIALLLIVVPAIAVAQPNPARDRAKPAYLKGWEHMRVEAYPEAAKAFQAAIDTDPEYEDAYYGFGLANMRLKQYRPALAAYEKCRDLYQAAAGKRFSDRQEVQRYRRERLTQIDEDMRQAQSGGSISLAAQERLRQLSEHRRQLQEALNRGTEMSVEQAVPAYVSVALGSAYFRLEQWPGAERAYKAAIAADPKSGEALNNLAVVYMQTGRYKEADDALKSAEKAGYKVHPQLKQDIKAKLG